MRFDAPLPIDAVLPEIARVLAERNSAVLVAPPGAGKTTRVPLALLDVPWRGDGRILVLEPRRIAARGAAERMASTTGGKVGGLVGLRARLASRTSAATRVEVVTEGVFTRMILDDPSLDGVAAVLFDEFHERSLDADLGLALALDAQRGLRDDLRILVMSATLDGARVAGLLGDAPVVTSEGRAFPVETHFLGRDPHMRIEDQMAAAVVSALARETGSILAFLPGQGEILGTQRRLEDRIKDPAVEIAPLYGAMDVAAQDRAVRPASAGRRKVVLATSIAETSITIEGVRVVIDSGLARVPRYDPGVGVTRLETVRASRASVDQRRGRAGRTEPGICYRLWDEPQTASLSAYSEPEINAADLSGLLLDCAAWGEMDPLRLSWLDPPPRASLSAAAEELRLLGALDEAGRITNAGVALRALPLPPRLGHMLQAAAPLGHAEGAAEVAAVIVERGLGGNDTDLSTRLAAFRRDRGRRAEDMRRLATGWARQASSHAGSNPPASTSWDDPSVAQLLALAYPDRIAKARGAPGQYLLANGRGAALEATDPLTRATYLVVADLTGVAARSRILLAAAAEESEILAIAGQRVIAGEELAFDPTAGALRARRTRRLGAIVLSSEPMSVPAGIEAGRLLAEAAARHGIGRIGWSAAQRQLRDRVGFLRAAGGGGDLPDLSDAVLAATAGDWLAPFLTDKMRLVDIDADVLGHALDALLPYRPRQELEAAAPTHFTAPTGNRHPIDYEGAGAPRLAVRVQELFGLKEHPAIAGGRLPLTLELLSPAHRPIQVTRDLPGFWAGSWSAVKSEMKGRYPKHVWPDDPANAAPTARAKPRGT